MLVRPGLRGCAKRHSANSAATVWRRLRSANHAPPPSVRLALRVGGSVGRDGNGPHGEERPQCGDDDHWRLGAAYEGSALGVSFDFLGGDPIEGHVGHRDVRYMGNRQSRRDHHTNGERQPRPTGGRANDRWRSQSNWVLSPRGRSDGCQFAHIDTVGGKPSSHKPITGSRAITPARSNARREPLLPRESPGRVESA
jgi:hypothetical protein